MQLFYHSEAEDTGQQIVFDKEESRHIVKVLRKSEGDELHLTNGKGYFFTSEIKSANPNKCQVLLNEKKKQEPLPYHLHLAVAPTKLNDRYEWFLEKATEIGISEITPIFCNHSERTKIKAERYEKILQSAMKQSLKAYLPMLNPAVSLSAFLEKNSKGSEKKYIAHCIETDKRSLKSELQKNENVVILVGPEGDFSEQEVVKALENGFIPVSLGKSRLRTETAAVVACHSVAFVNED